MHAPVPSRSRELIGCSAVASPNRFRLERIFLTARQSLSFPSACWSLYLKPASPNVFRAFRRRLASCRSKVFNANGCCVSIGNSPFRANARSLTNNTIANHVTVRLYHSREERLTNLSADLAFGPSLRSNEKRG
jgi:hypothetical protein